MKEDADVQHLSAKLAEHEARGGLAEGATRIMAIATETAASLFGLGSYQNADARLCALTWGAEDLSTALGASTNLDPSGGWALVYRLAL